MERGNVVALLHALTGVVVMVVSLYTRVGFLVTMGFLKYAGYLIFLLGMALFALSIVFLKRAFLGNVKPVTGTLVTGGPYRIVRHPIYLAMVVSTLGLAVGLRSLWGLVVTLVCFAPLGIYRARLEEQALARHFGKQWDDYRRATYFMFPPIY